jgi:hypothetical protein
MASPTQAQWPAAPRDRSKQLQRTSSASLDDLVRCVEELDKEHAGKSRARLVSEKIAPLVAFLERYGKAIDVLVQSADGALTVPVSLAWGILRVLLVSSSAFTQYFPKVLDMIESLGATVSLYRGYEALFDKDARFKTCLSRVYAQVSTLLLKAHKVFQRRGKLI